MLLSLVIAPLIAATIVVECTGPSKKAPQPPGRQVRLGILILLAVVLYFVTRHVTTPGTSGTLVASLLIAGFGGSMLGPLIAAILKKFRIDVGV